MSENIGYLFAVHQIGPEREIARDIPLRDAVALIEKMESNHSWPEGCDAIFEIDENRYYVDDEGVWRSVDDMSTWMNPEDINPEDEDC